MDVTEQHEARAALETAFEEIKKLKDQLYKENIALREEIDSASMFEEVVGASLGGGPETRVGSGGLWPPNSVCRPLLLRRGSRP